MFDWHVLLAIFIGVTGGITIGALPGLTATMGVALLVPFTFGRPPVESLGMLLGIYCGGMYGGSISAILIRTPGRRQLLRRCSKAIRWASAAKPVAPWPRCSPHSVVACSVRW